MPPDLTIYRDMFVHLIETDNATVIENNSRDHAKIILQELVRSARESVHIICTHFSRAVYDDPALQTAIMDAISRGVAVHIAIRDNFPQAAEFYNRLLSFSPQTCQYRTGIHSNRNAFANDFCVVDQRRYRLERDQEAGTAYVCANNPSISRRLVQLFLISAPETGTAA